ncbi:MAG: TetR/AcrR family transcriptional regulator [Novosphingobium sp.]
MATVDVIEGTAEKLAKRGAKADRVAISHNLNGQKLGRKGQLTRERIMAATVVLINESADTAISLSAVARRAGLGMTSLYVYFNDLTELVLAVLEPIMHEAGDAAGYFSLLEEYWPDDRLEECCQTFIESYYAFWTKHSRILHLRNNMADQYDERMISARVASAQPVMAMLRRQLTFPGKEVSSSASNMASILMTGIERAVTVATDPVTPAYVERAFGPRNTNVVEPLSRLMFLAVRDCREAARV